MQRNFAGMIRLFLFLSSSSSLFPPLWLRSRPCASLAAAAFVAVSPHHRRSSSSFTSSSRRDISSSNQQQARRAFQFSSLGPFVSRWPRSQRSFSVLHATTTAPCAELCIGETVPSITADNDQMSVTSIWIGTKSILQAMAKSPSMLASLPNNNDKKDQNNYGPLIQAMLQRQKENTAFTTVLPPDGRHTLVLCVLPETVSRNNHPLSLHKLTELVQSNAVVADNNSDDGTAVVTSIWVGGVTHSAPVAAAVARAFPLYSQKTRAVKDDDDDNDAETKAPRIYLTCLDADLNPLPHNPADGAVAKGVRLACELVDTPPQELTTEEFSRRAKHVADQASSGMVAYREIVGTDLRDQGYGGLYGIGKAAQCPPRMVILEYSPQSALTASSSSSDGGNEDVEDDIETHVWVGKGIVYDTGGLSLKTKTGMPGMKSDCGGAAGMLGAFQAAVDLKVKQKLVLILCLAENAIGPAAVRNDDILKLYSGKTVEINNSDAEGRVVLGDGVAHATKHYDCSVVVDMATLTGAQMVTTGQLHGGILANSQDLEKKAVKAGLLSGDLVFPMLYAPELLKSEFKSSVADMKNSVKNRSNAQSSCAGHFIESHLDENYKNSWLHVDMAGPSVSKERGTGYGVALLLALLGAL